MTSIVDHQTTFIFSSLTPPTEDYFQGYCFVGADLIFGSAGARKYIETTGNGITSGLDGCYVHVTRNNNAYVFETDFAGYKALYYFHDGRIWAVSNSFARVVDFLREQNIPVSPNYPHLSTMAGRGMAAGQLFTFSTLAREVYVVPPRSTITITPTRAVLSRRPRAEEPLLDYDQALSEHIDLWVRRYETLMLDDIANFTTDLTGGVDSRANFALVLAARRRLSGAGAAPRLNCGSTPTNRSDIEIAEQLSSHYGLELNDKRRFQAHSLSPEESYETFRNLSLGVYYPLYLPAKGPTPTDISISGGGGGIHRKIYERHQKSASIEKFIRNFARKSGRPEYQAEIIRDARSMLNNIEEPGDDPLRAHLRDARVRYHSGRSPRFNVTFTPLHSVSSHRAQKHAGAERTEEGQFNYDIMHVVDSELPDLPYDEDYKLPTTSIRSRLSRASLSAEAHPGKVWAGDLVLNRGVTSSNKARMVELNSAFEEAIEDEFVTSFWDKEHLAKASELMANLVDGQSIGNAANGKPIHSIIATSLVTPS